MGLSDELQDGIGSLWERVVTHPFIIELGDGTLPQEIFDVYFEQDYLFVKELVILRSLAKAKAPDYADAAGHFGLGGEGGHFQQFFRERGLSPQDVANLEYRPTTLHYSSYLRKMAYEGRFIRSDNHLVGRGVAIPGMGAAASRSREASRQLLLPGLGLTTTRTST